MMPDVPVGKVYARLADMVGQFYRLGMRHAVVCPGSRSAPLALAFLRHPQIKTFVLTDERSAAYTALGIAQATGTPVAVVSTSGTAACNFLPAVAEAFFSRVPLLALTADRPEEWLGQNDNQAIYQHRLYGKHTPFFATLPVAEAFPMAEKFLGRLIGEAWDSLLLGNPVHLNVPLREPLYTSESPTSTEENITPYATARPTGGAPMLPNAEKKLMIVAGMMPPDAETQLWLGKLASLSNVAVLADVTANLHRQERIIKSFDLFLRHQRAGSLPLPEMLITCGGPVVSKPLKQYLRGLQGLVHWHVGQKHPAADTFLHLEQNIVAEPAAWMKALYEHLTTPPRHSQFATAWLDMEIMALRKTDEVLQTAQFYSETLLMGQILKQMPLGCHLHLGNSLAIRHASLQAGIVKAKAVWSNRGTSGIDGSLSTAAGHSMACADQHLLVCGDLSFLYDHNSLWNQYLGRNLKIVVMNNGGGAIFRELQGASAQPERENYFAAAHGFQCRHAALLYACAYQETTPEKLKEGLAWLFASEGSRPAVLELTLPPEPAMQSFIRASLAF